MSESIPNLNALKLFLQNEHATAIDLISTIDRTDDDPAHYKYTRGYAAGRKELVEELIEEFFPDLRSVKE